MTQFPDDFRDFLEALNTHRVRYLVAGGFALAAHGHPRYTKDLDIWVEVSEDNAANLLAALNDFGMGSLGLSVADFMTKDIVVQLIPQSFSSEKPSGARNGERVARREWRGGALFAEARNGRLATLGL